MVMSKGDPRYTVTPRRVLFAERGTELKVSPLLEGIRALSGEKIQWYLASELRDRIRQTGVSIRVADRTARAEYKVEPRQFEGRLLHELDATLPAHGEIYAELYLTAHSPANRVSLYRSGTRVLENLADLDAFARAPWSSGYVQGIVDVPYLNLTPGTRLGVIHDAALARLVDELAPLETRLAQIVADQQRAEEERASRDVLRSVQGALKEALLALPAEEYDWFDLHRGEGRRRPAPAAEEPARAQDDDGGAASSPAAVSQEAVTSGEVEEPQRQFYQFAGPLFSVVVAPTSSVVEVGGSRRLRAVARDRSRRPVDADVTYAWKLLEGDGTLLPLDREIATFTAASEPGLVRLGATASQGDVACSAEAQITVTASLATRNAGGNGSFQGLPGYTYERAAGELWRSRFDADRNLVVVNSGHRDFVFAARHRTLKLRYICRLFAKELVLKNFVGVPQEQLLERLLELTLYTEENLR
jgi:hypothetical protein